MKKVSYVFVLFLMVSCTSNTIFEKPKDLIPKDTMSLLIQEMMIASSSKYIKNTNLEKNINYMPFVYERFKIDSVRFKESNFYYMSKIDEYTKIFETAKKNLEIQKKYYTDLNSKMDSIKRDSLDKFRKEKLEVDSLLVPIINDSVKKKRVNL